MSNKQKLRKIKFRKLIQPLLKSFVILALVFGITFGHMDSAAAARTGGRIGGGSFRVPTSRTYTPRTYNPGGGYYAPAPGGFGFPFLLPFFGFGGFSGILGLFVMIAIANVFLRSIQRMGSGDNGGDLTYTSNPSVSINRLQVGLLANARSLQPELNRIAEFADTNTSQGRTQILQEVSLALLRHPEYWSYAATTTQQAKLTTAEAEFNRLTLAERSKFTQETLANVHNQLNAATNKEALPGDGNSSFVNEPGEYIVVTIITASLGKFTLPSVNSVADLQTALKQIGSLGSENLLAIEVIWTPQAEGDTLSSDDLLANYADLKLV